MNSVCAQRVISHGRRDAIKELTKHQRSHALKNIDFQTIIRPGLTPFLVFQKIPIMTTPF